MLIFVTEMLTFYFFTELEVEYARQVTAMGCPREQRDTLRGVTQSSFTFSQYVTLLL
jgi:hypothetical protein